MKEPGPVDRSLYPFRSRFAETPHGRMHYVDEGVGSVVLLVHGTPTWSFLFRDLIRDLSRDHRVVAIDHLGFGLSDKPENAPYRPRDHAARLSGLIDDLGLRDITLVVHDFGGPIGLSCAIERPEIVRALVLMNTWMWSLAGTPAEKASRLFSTGLGRMLYTRLNFSPRVLLKWAFADRSSLSAEIHRHYLLPFPDRARREAPWVFARELAGSGDWFEDLWNRRDRIADKPALLLWGMKDPLLRPDFLERWREALPHARVRELEETGHFVPEEADPEVLAEAIRGLGGVGGGRSRPIPGSGPAGPGEG